MSDQKSNNPFEDLDRHYAEQEMHNRGLPSYSSAVGDSAPERSAISDSKNGEGVQKESMDYSSLPEVVVPESSSNDVPAPLTVASRSTPSGATSPYRGPSPGAPQYQPSPYQSPPQNQGPPQLPNAPYQGSASEYFGSAPNPGAPQYPGNPGYQGPPIGGPNYPPSQYPEGPQDIGAPAYSGPPPGAPQYPPSQYPEGSQDIGAPQYIGGPEFQGPPPFVGQPQDSNAPQYPGAQTNVAAPMPFFPEGSPFPGGMQGPGGPPLPLSQNRIIAIPAIDSTPGSPFIRGYVPMLEKYNLPKGPFLKFLDSLNETVMTNPPMQVLEVTGGILKSVPILFPLHWLGSAFNGIASLSEGERSKGRSDQAIKQANKEIFASHGLKAELANFDALAYLAKIPILDAQGKVDKKTPLVRHLADLSKKSPDDLSATQGQELEMELQLQRLRALQPWISDIELDVKPMTGKSRLTRLNSALKKYNNPRRRDRFNESQAGDGKDRFRKCLWLIIREVGSE
ncbi:hypothetical protein PENSTE_c001G07563 [Penicillium steckii]|uniref:Uncharacterized protein n=1 Tax=Penicillium steckii TaxID=303698 RepID=A0A1V6U111_9EURO|nr:hypothetical protein PENSTE_c001G07563 [Penicillium steckii]